MEKYKKYLLSSLTLVAPIALTVSCHSAQASTKSIQQENQVKEVKKIYSNNTVNGHLFEFKKVDSKALIISTEANDYYLTPKEIGSAGSIILRGGLILEWNKPLTSNSTINDFSILNANASTYLNYLKVLKPEKESSLLNVNIDGEIRNFYFSSTFDLEKTIIAYLNYWTKKDSSFWKLDSLGKTRSGRKGILNKLIKSSGFSVHYSYGTITDGIYTIVGLRL